MIRGRVENPLSELKYSDNVDVPAASLCPVCRAGETDECNRGTFVSYCNVEECDVGYIGIDGSVPTILKPGPGKSPVISARYRQGLPIWLEDDAKTTDESDFDPDVNWQWDEPIGESEMKTTSKNPSSKLPYVMTLRIYRKIVTEDSWSFT